MVGVDVFEGGCEIERFGGGGCLCSGFGLVF